MRQGKKAGVAAVFGILILAAMTGCQSLFSRGNPTVTPEVDAAAKVQDLHATDSRKSQQSERALCIETARTMAAAGHLREAILLYEKAEAMDPSLPRLDAELAGLLASAGDYPRAIERYRRSLAREAHPELWNNLAWTLIEANRIDEAHRETVEALRQYPEDERLRTTAAIVDYRRGDRQSALAKFEQLQGKAAAYHNLGVLDIEAGQAEQAVASLELSLSHATEDNPLTRQLLDQVRRQREMASKGAADRSENAWVAQGRAVQQRGVAKDR